MKAIGLVLALVAGNAFAQGFEVMKPIVCGDADRVLTEITGEKWGEKIVWSGYERSSESFYALFMNDDTTTWTLIQTNSKTACIVGSGDKSLLPK